MAPSSNSFANLPLTGSSDIVRPLQNHQHQHQHQHQQQQQQQQQQQLQTTASSATAALESSQKRKRVTRACDECRKKKVKCDGQQPCIHCTVYSYDCTYDQPSNRKKSSADVHLIEQKLKNAEQVLNMLLPELDVLDSNFSFDVLESLFNNNYKHLTNKNGQLDELTKEYKSKASHFKLKDDMKSPASTASTPNSTSVRQSSSTNDSKLKKRKLNFPHPNIDGSIESKEGREIKIMLPPKNVALELVTKTWASPCILFRFYHRPSFIKDLDELYETDPENYTNKQNKFLPLAYSVMAVGALFSKKNGVDDKFLDDEGYRYFVAARKLIDITDARDLYAIQTIVMLILFLQCSARLSTCYSYIGVALRSALREGLHRKVEHPFNPIEIETRKRLFWTIYKMDIYVNTMLGLPRSIAPEDIDQDLPLELDDENITENGYLPQEPGKLSSSAIANNHTNLIMVLNNIVKNLYPINSDLRVISHEKVSEMELELRGWLSNLPRELIPGYDPPYQYYKANRVLHLAFLHVQIVLYRPFIHYVSPKYTSQPNVDTLSIQRAKNCISVARTVVNLAQDMIKRNMLSGSYWFSIYTIFFSVACLVYYVHEVPFDEFHPDYIGIRHDAETGKEILTLLKDSSMAASKIYNILNSLFEQLNRRTVTLHEQRHRQLEEEQKKNQQYHEEQEYKIREQHIQQAAVPCSTNLQHSNSKSQLDTQAVPIPQNLTAHAANSPLTSPQADQKKFNSTGNTKYSQDQFSSKFADITSPYPNIKLEESLNDFDHLANFDNFINQPPTSNLANHVARGNADIVGSPNNSSVSATNLDHINGASDNKTEDYMPGIIDQLDMQIFGRFLPPYMLKRPNGTTGPGPNGGDLPSGLNTTNDPTSLDDLPTLSGDFNSFGVDESNGSNTANNANNNNNNNNNVTNTAAATTASNNDNTNNTPNNNNSNQPSGSNNPHNNANKLSFSNLDNWPDLDQNVYWT